MFVDDVYQCLRIDDMAVFIQKTEDYTEQLTRFIRHLRECLDSYVSDTLRVGQSCYAVGAGDTSDADGSRGVSSFRQQTTLSVVGRRAT